MYNEKQYRHRRRKKYRIKPLPVACALLSVFIVIGGIYFLFFKSDGYDKYRIYNEENKAYGTIKNFEDNTDDFFISIFYPQFEDKNLNKIVNTTYTDLINEQKKKENQKDILYMDYSCKNIFKQFIVIQFDFTRIDEHNEKKTQIKKVLSYNSKTKQLLSLKDCLHGKYHDLLTSLGVKKIDKNSTNIQIDKKSFTYYQNDNMKDGIKINYSKNKDFIKLANKEIPSNAPLNIKAPKYMKVDKKKKMVAITLDDGPHKTLTDRAMNAFEKYGGRGTFFELGKTMEIYPDIVKNVYERGHEIASHTYSHSQLNKLTSDKLDEEIKKTQELCFKITGDEPGLVRPPYGAKNDTVKSAFQSYGLTMILWDGDTEDWRYSKKTNGAQIICDNIVRDATANTGDGNIVLIHDIHQNSIEGLEMALKILNKKGYQFVTVSDLLKYNGHREYR